MAQIDTLTNVGAVVSTDLALILRGGANVLGTFGSLVGQNATAVTITQCYAAVGCDFSRYRQGCEPPVLTALE